MLWLDLSSTLSVHGVSESKVRNYPDTGVGDVGGARRGDGGATPDADATFVYDDVSVVVRSAHQRT